MNKIRFFLFSLFIGYNSLSSQQQVDFEYALPENSHFIVNNKIESVGIMKITGDKAEMEALKKIGYRQERTISYVFDMDINMKTFQKTEESFPFEFNYEKVKIDVDSDGKKNNQLLSFSDITISGDLRKDKEIITNVSKSGNSVKDNFINTMPREFLRPMISQKGMKVGDQFTVEKVVQSLKDNFKTNGAFSYTLKKIDTELAYFDVVINLLKDQTSDLQVAGTGSGEMIFNYIKQYVVSENTTLKVGAVQIERTFKIDAETDVKSSFFIKLIE